MGACASKFKELKEASDAPPAPKEEEAAVRELSLVDEIVKKDDAPAADNEVKLQSLRHLFKEGEAEKGTVGNNGKACEEVKQDDVKTQEKGNEESPKPVADTPTKDENEKPTAKVEDVKPETSEEKKAENEKPAAENVEAEGVADKICCVDKKSETPDAGKMNMDENQAEETKLEISETETIQEQKPVPDAEENKKDTKASTIEVSEKVEDKLAVELLETEMAVEKKPEDKSVTDMKPESPDTIEPKELSPALDARGPKAGEEKTANC